MGKRRPGKRERARVKKSHRGQYWCAVGGVGTASVKAGRKKIWKVVCYVNRILDAARLSGESLVIGPYRMTRTSKSAISIERPLYKIEISPAAGDLLQCR